MNQNPRYVTSSLSFNELNFQQFVGGECRTILRTTDVTEILGRLRILSKVSYLYYQCKSWDRARSAYFAILSSIEEGEALWNSNFGHYDMMCPAPQDMKYDKGIVKPKVSVKKEFFCREFQKGECTLNPPHKSWI